MPTPTNETTPQWQSYLDLANDVKPYLQIPTTDTTRDTDLLDVLDAACWWAQDYLGRPIALTEFFRRFSGWQTGSSGSFVSLPYSPVVVDTAHPISVIEWWGTSGPQTLVEQTPAAQGSGTAQMFQLEALEGIIIRTVPGLIARPFFPGVRNIEVTWWAGYSPVPRHWIMATKELVKYWWANTQQSSRSFQARGEYDQEPVAHYGLWPAIPDRISSMFSTGLQVGIG